ISLRQALARLGVSVSMAWDAKQAADLLDMVKPEVAIIDLELPPKDGCALVARMALAKPAPLTIVIPKAIDTAAAFATAAAHPDQGSAHAYARADVRSGRSVRRRGSSLAGLSPRAGQRGPTQPSDRFWRAAIAASDSRAAATVSASAARSSTARKCW